MELIQDHGVFHNNSNNPQLPVARQLAIYLYHAGDYGNACSVEAVAAWAGVSVGTVENCTKQVMVAVLNQHDFALHPPTENEKNTSKRWAERKVDKVWRNGHLSCDGTTFPFWQQPGLHGEAWFDKSSRYSANAQVRNLTNHIIHYLHIYTSASCAVAQLGVCGLLYQPHRQHPQFICFPEY